MMAVPICKQAFPLVTARGKLKTFEDWVYENEMIRFCTLLVISIFTSSHPFFWGEFHKTEMLQAFPRKRVKSAALPLRFIHLFGFGFGREGGLPETVHSFSAFSLPPPILGFCGGCGWGMLPVHWNTTSANWKMLYRIEEEEEHYPSQKADDAKKKVFTYSLFLLSAQEWKTEVCIKYRMNEMCLLLNRHFSQIAIA